MQLEFEFTWFVFCDLVDNESGEIVGGSVLECYHDDLNPFFEWIITPEEMETFEYCPFSPSVAVKECA